MACSVDEIRQNYKDLLEYSSDYLFILDVNGKIMDMNNKVLQNPEFFSSKILNTNIYEYLVSQKDYHELDLNTQLMQYKSTEEPLTYRLEKKGRLPVFLKIDKIPLKKDNELIAFLGIGHDITKEIKTDIALYESSTPREGLEVIINHSPVVAILLKNNEKMSIEFISDNISQFGYESSDFLSGELHYSNIVYPDDLEGLKEKLMQHSKENDNQFTHEYRIITKDGQIKWIDNQIWPKRNEKGVITHYQGIVLDITEKKIVELKLKESEESFRNLFKGIPYYSAAWQKVKDDFILFEFNNIAERFSSFNLKELLGKSVTKMPRANGEFQQEYIKNLNRCFKEKNRFTIEIESYIDVLKRKRFLLATFNFVPPDLVFLYIEDITRRKKAEKQLKESEEKFRRLFEGSPHYTVAWEKKDGDFIISDYNNNAKTFSRGMIIAKIGTTAHKRFLKDDNRPDLIENLNQCFEEKKNYSIETKLYVDFLDQERDLNIIYNYVPPNFVVTYTEDITDRKRAEQELKESSERFRRLFEGSPHYTIAWQKQNDDYIIFDMNKIAKEINREYARNVIGRKASETGVSYTIENLNKCFEEKMNFSIETKMYIEFLGRDRYLNIIYSYVPPNFVVTYIEDINTKKRAEQKLRDSEEKYRTIIENAKEGYYEVDLNGNYTLVNNAYCKLLEYSREEIVGQSYQKFTTKENAEKTFTAFNTVYKTGIEQSSFDYILLNKNGKIKYGDISIHLIYDKDGKKVGFRGFLKETTERKLAEEQLKESEIRFRNLFKESPHFTLAWQRINDDFIIIDYNNAAIQLTQGIIKDSTGATASQMYLKEMYRPDLIENLKECCQKKITYTKEFKMYLDYFKRELDLLVTYCYIPPNIVLTIVEDITSRKRAQQQLKESEQKYRNAYERENFYKDLFAHDMRNILQGMLSSLDLCDIMVTNPNQIKDILDILNILRKQVQRGSNLVKNVRKFSELQDSDIKMKSMIIKEHLEKAINMVKKSSLTKTIHFQIESFDDKIMINADEFLLDVFENILFNAVKHNENSIIEILIKLSELQEENKKYLKIEFMDNGYGVEDSRKQSIFKRGYKEDRSVAGIGLGLSLVYNILNRYSAKIWIEDRVTEDYTQGSNFIIQFPLK